MKKNCLKTTKIDFKVDLKTKTCKKELELLDVRVELYDHLKIRKNIQIIYLKMMWKKNDSFKMKYRSFTEIISWKL